MTLLTVTSCVCDDLDAVVQVVVRGPAAQVEGEGDQEGAQAWHAAVEETRPEDAGCERDEELEGLVGVIGLVEAEVDEFLAHRLKVTADLRAKHVRVRRRVRRVASHHLHLLVSCWRVVPAMGRQPKGEG